MKKILFILIFLFGINYAKSYNSIYKLLPNYSDWVIKTQVTFDPNNIRCYIWNTGVFDQDLRTNNTAGFEWPINSGKTAIFTAGLCIGSIVNGEIRMANASYNGEYCPGYALNGQFYTDSRFRFWRVKRGDNYITNPDWLNWDLMVQYGAPYVDVNHNGLYELFVDTPGVKNANQTLFICLTDADPTTHTTSEGFSGGTAPLFAEVHLTAWGYDNPGLENIQFLKWEIINHGLFLWDSTYIAIASDPDLGWANDDYVGCDTVRRLAYIYNADNMDGTGSMGQYGLDPPAAGFVFLKGAYYQNHHLGAYTIRVWNKAHWPCDHDPSSVPQAYNMLKGLKNDGTPIVIPLTNPPIITRYTFPGDPETMTGWTEYGGWVDNCGSLYGQILIPSPAGDRRLILGTGSPNLKVNPNDTQKIFAAQLIARGSNHKNSVTLLKQLADVAQNLYDSGFVIGIEPINNEVPLLFKLYQNYPNPFNPKTKIKFDIPPLSFGEGQEVRLIIYNILGQQIATLVNEPLKPGTYDIEWDGSNFASGIYFYQLISSDYFETKKMILLK